MNWGTEWKVTDGPNNKYTIRSTSGLYKVYDANANAVDAPRQVIYDILGPGGNGLNILLDKDNPDGSYTAADNASDVVIVAYDADGTEYNPVGQDATFYQNLEGVRFQVKLGRALSNKLCPPIFRLTWDCRRFR